MSAAVMQRVGTVGLKVLVQIQQTYSKVTEYFVMWIYVLWNPVEAECTWGMGSL